MINLIAAAAFFVLLHLLISGTSIRTAMVKIIGEGAYMGLFSVASVAGLVWLGLAYGQSRGEAWNIAYWGLTPATRHAQLGLMLLAMLLIVPGLTTPNPTSVKQEGALNKPNAVQGMLRITRHPFLWGVAIWAGGHLMVNGDRASIALFGSMLVLAVFGTVSIDGKRLKALGETYTAFTNQTSNLPFAAILTGKQSLKIGEIGLWRLILAVAIWAGIMIGHQYAFGVAALPG